PRSFEKRTGRKEEMKVLSIELKRKKPKLILEDYKHDERWKYLYALSTGRRGIGPSWVIDLRSKEGLDEKIKTGLKEIKNGQKRLMNTLEHKIVSDKQTKEALEWLKCLDKLPDIVTKIKNVARGMKILLTIECDGKKGGEIPGLRAAFTKVKLIGERRAWASGHHMCGVCGESAEVRSSLPFKFSPYYDKLGFLPMAQEMQSWKCAPLCENCTKWLSIAADFLDTCLSVFVAGKRAYLLPNLELRISKMPNKFVQYLYEFRKRAEGRIVPEHEEFPQIESNPFEYLLEEYNWKRGPPFRSASLIFYQPGQKFLFLYSTSDVVPGQLKAFSERLKYFRERCSFLGEAGEKLSRELRGDLRFVAQAWQWPDGKRAVTPLKLSSMNLVEFLLTKNPSFFDIFLTDADKILRRVYSDTITTRISTVKQAISDRTMLIWALYTLLYVNDKVGGKVASSKNVLTEAWTKFFEDLKGVDTDAKRAIYLIGVLFGQVEYAQRRERGDWKGEMPILSALRGLAISATEIKERLFPELSLKLRQLSSYSLPLSEIEARASYHLARAEDISNERARFMFCLGWTLDKYTVDFIGEALFKEGKGGKKHAEK
ncbi:MAG: TM1802 family CRISPR-associated protein, partial [Candidatus Thermoplasmatota archaeon]